MPFIEDFLLLFLALPADKLGYRIVQVRGFLKSICCKLKAGQFIIPL